MSTLNAVAFSSLALLVACSGAPQSAPAQGAAPQSEPTPDVGAPSDPESPAADSPQESPVSSDVPAGGGSVAKDGGVEPHEPSTPRNCGAPMTKPFPAGTFVTLVNANHGDLGRGIDASAVGDLSSFAYATGTVGATRSSESFLRSGAGLDEDGLRFLGAALGGADGNLYWDPGQISFWAKFVGAKPTRFTYGSAMRAAGTYFGLENPIRTVNTPPPPATFIRGIHAEALFAYVFGVELDSDCKVMALGDALGGTPNAATMLDDVAHRQAISNLLVANGARLTIHVIGNKPHPAIDALFAASHCSSADLGECKRVVDGIKDEMVAWSKDNATTTTMDALTNKTDPHWSALTYSTANVDELR